MRRLLARLDAFHRRHGRITLGKAGVLIVFVVGAAILYFTLFRPGPPNVDEVAIRGWFSSAAGGGAPPVIVKQLHVGTCTYTHASLHGTPVLACPVNAAGFSFDGCFTIDDAGRVDGGWAVTSGDCESVRWSEHAAAFVDEGLGQPVQRAG